MDFETGLHQTPLAVQVGAPAQAHRVLEEIPREHEMMEKSTGTKIWQWWCEMEMAMLQDHLFNHLHQQLCASTVWARLKKRE